MSRIRSRWEARYDRHESDVVDANANARDRKRRAALQMVVSNRSVFTIRDTIQRKAQEARDEH